jgi:Zn-dependent metalloprotease
VRKTLAAISAVLLTSGGLVGVTTSASAAPAGPGARQQLDAAAVARGEAALRAHGAELKTAAGETDTVYSTSKDGSGAVHVRYTRTYRGLAVHAGDFVVHTAPNGDYAGASVGLVAPLSLDTTPKISAAAAADTARKEFRGRIASVGSATLIVDASSGTGRLAWETVVTGTSSETRFDSKLHVLTDANTGAVIGSYDAVETVTGTGNSLFLGPVPIDTTPDGTAFDMIDPVRGNGTTCDMHNTEDGPCTTFTDADNTWGNSNNSDRATAAVDAHFGAAVTYDYYKNVHARNGIFGDGRGVPSRVHYGDNYVNAGWEDGEMSYGDGENNAHPLVALDVAGHEMTHGVTEAVVPGGLNYVGESGGLNESTSDIFGTMVEFYADNPADPGDYDIGEKIDINGDGTPLRYMYDPALDGLSDSCWSPATAAKNVHYSSGVGNHFYFDLAEGTGATQYGTSPVCGTAKAVTGIGRAKAEQIWYRALSTYFTSTTAYVNATNPGNTARAYSLKAATDLYGECSVEYRTVQAAWTAVNVAGSDNVCTSDGNDFTVTVAPTGATVTPGGTAAAVVSTATSLGNPQTVTLSATGVPSGAVVSFTPSSVTSGGQSALTVKAGAATAPGTYPITITGKGTLVSHSTTFTLTVKSLCPSPGQKLGNPGFESGTAPWTASPSVIGAYTGEQPHGGTRYAWLNGYGATHTDTLAQSVTLPAGCAAYTLSFWLHVDSKDTSATAHDTLKVQVLDGAGAVAGTLATYSNLDRGDGYQQRSVSLAAFAGQSVTVKFTGTENASQATSFVIDDTAVTVS